MIETAAYLDDLYPSGHLRQAKVNVLPALHLSRRLCRGALQGGCSPRAGHLKVCLLRENDVPNELRRMLRLTAPSPDIVD